MNEIEVRTMSFEPLVRKRIASFVERILQCLGYDFRHEIFKGIVYAEVEVKTSTEAWIKNCYDAFLYLISNYQNPCSEELLNKFFYILKGKEVSNMITARISSKYFWLLDLPPLEQAIELHNIAYQELFEFEESEKTMISLMLLNYALIKGGIPCIRILKANFTSYLKEREDKIEFYNFILNLIRFSKFQKKFYYKKLQPLQFNEIYQRIKADRIILQENYGIKHICVYGSFSKGQERIDSDIDLLVVFKEEVLKLDKTRTKDKFKEHYEKIFHRFVDLTEISLITNDRVIKEMTSYKQIF